MGFCIDTKSILFRHVYVIVDLFYFLYIHLYVIDTCMNVLSCTDGEVSGHTHTSPTQERLVTSF